LKLLLLVGQNLSWRVGNGEMVQLGIDHVLGNGNNYIFPPDMIEYLHAHGFFTLAHIRKPYFLQFRFDYWLQAQDIGLRDD